ncbi:hypothetical protein Sango_1506000 [Sesamum angolense]|uniref:Uncharacterized protein n=1 Tax=Sesamum angolense TaxID=2727404 RepID=A0AAE2BT08_9LAMI|nr:hypothetical protein Sango_1506000 [Sesamum angolense]
MAFRQIVFLLLVFLPMILAAFTWADTVLLSEDVADLRDQDGAVSQSEAAELELRQLKSKISYLETIIEDRTAEVKRKDGGIKQLEKVIEEKSNSLASLQTVEKESSEVKERIGEVNARANELEKQILNLNKEIEAQNRKKDKLESQANAAEEKIEGLKLKLEKLQKINNEQTSRIHKAQRALQAAEEEMLKAKLEASSMTKQLKESFVLTLWNQIGRPVFNPTIQEALKQKYEVEKWVRHHLETIKRKWFPTINEHYKAIVENYHPLLQSFSTQAIQYHHVAQSTIKRHILNIQETVDPYFQEAKMFMKPYVDQVTGFDKACLFVKPFSRKVQATLHETLNSYELTKPLATEGLVQFLDLYNFDSFASIRPPLHMWSHMNQQVTPMNMSADARRKEPKKRQRSSHRSHTRQRAKRANASK